MENTNANKDVRYELIERKEDDNTSVGRYATLKEALADLMNNVRITLLHDAQITDNAYLYDIDDQDIGVSVIRLDAKNTKITEAGAYQIKFSPKSDPWSGTVQTRFSTFKDCLQEVTRLIHESMISDEPIDLDITKDNTSICHFFTLNG